MAKTVKSPEERIQEAADFVEEKAEEILAEVGDDAAADEEVEIFDDPADEPAPGEPLATPEAADTLALIERAAVSDEVSDWNKVADRLYELERLKHKRPGLHSSTLGRLLERLP